MILKRFLIGMIGCVFTVTAAGCCLFGPPILPPVNIDSGAEQYGVVGQNEDGWRVYRSSTGYEIYDPILKKWYPAVRNYKNDTVVMPDETMKQWRKDRAALPEDRQKIGVTVKPGVGGDGGGTCFAAETLILMADDTRKRIIDVKKGDRVKAYNEKTGRIETRKVTLSEDGRHDDYYLINGTLKATPPHPFYTMDRGWVGLDNLKAGDRIKSPDGENEIFSIVKVAQPLKIYNIRVETRENFFVSGDGAGFFLVK